MAADGENSSAPSPTPSTPPRARSWRPVLILVALAAFIIGALATAWPRLNDTSDRDRIAALEVKLAQVGAELDTARRDAQGAEARLATVERNTPGIANADTGLTLEQRVGVLEQSGTANTQAVAAMAARLNSIEAATPPDLPQQLQNFASRDEQAALDARVKQLESVKHAAALLAMARLSRAAEAAQPFGREFDVLASIAPDDPSIAILRPLAPRSVAAKTDLANVFPNVARGAINAERAALANSFWDRLANGMVRLIGWRRVGDIPGETTEARLARAQVALDRNNLPAAATELRGLAGPARITMMPWLLDAEARIAVDRAIADMDGRMLQALAAPVPIPAEPAPATSAPAP